MRPVCAWLRALKRRHLKAFVQHPHHYVVAAGLTLIALFFGHLEDGFFLSVWGYAVLENLASLVDDV